MSEHLLDVQHLQTVFRMHDGLFHAVNDVSFHVDEGEIIGIVGESGSGKSVSMMSLLKLIAIPPGEIVGGQAFFQGQDILKYGPKSKEIRKIRGGGISMIFQEPQTSLNPVLTVGQQIEESIMLHLDYSKSEARKRAIELLGLVGIPDGASRIDYYPPQFSGGMRQRVMIAMAMSCNPKILIADEATTALDVTTQEQILDLLQEIVRKTNTSLIIITHNLSIIARYAKRIYVMYAGRIVERGTADEIFYETSHPYTMGLLKAVPRLDGDKSQRLVAIEGLPPGSTREVEACPFFERCPYAVEDCAEKSFPAYIEYSETHAAACRFRADRLVKTEKKDAVPVRQKSVSSETILELKHVSKIYPVGKGFFRRRIADVRPLDDISFSIQKGETVGLVGESGCGKTTTAKAILRLLDIDEGQILFHGRDISKLRERQLGDVRREVQFIFQDPFGALDPRQSAGNIVGESIKAHGLAKSRGEYDRKIQACFEAVGLDPALKDRVPHEFSGGQRQRLSIASALASEPSFIICDEPISALDVSIQAQIINLLIDLQSKRGLTYLFIAHDLSVVRHISDRIVVMYLGKIVEISPWNELYEKPLHPYTRALLSAIPIPDPAIERQRVRVGIQGEVPSLMNRPGGCVFHPRCPYATEECRNSVPPLREFSGGHSAACHKMEQFGSQ